MGPKHTPVGQRVARVITDSLEHVEHVPEIASFQLVTHINTILSEHCLAENLQLDTQTIKRNSTEL